MLGTLLLEGAVDASDVAIGGGIGVGLPAAAAVLRGEIGRVVDGIVAFLSRRAEAALVRAQAERDAVDQARAVPTAASDLRVAAATLAEITNGMRAQLQSLASALERLHDRQRHPIDPED